MVRSFCSMLAAVILLSLSVRDASAQIGAAWTDRGYAALNVGFETTSGVLNDAVTFPLFGENGTKTVEQGTDSGSMIDFSVGSRVWRNVSVGIGFHRGGTSGEAAVTAQVPNPVFFNRNRAVALGVSELDRTERAIHLHFGYMLPVNEDLSVHVFAGPSFYRVSQDVVSDVTFTEQAFPFTTVDAAAVVTERTDSATGGNIGIDVAYKLYETTEFKLGAGMFLRYSGASAKIVVLQNEVDSDMGGLQIGFGARVRF
jgi:hypothetical protein